MHIISLGLVQLYSIPIPVYGPNHYTTFEKKIDIELNEQSGSGANDEAEPKSQVESGDKDPVLDKLNEKKKGKLDHSIYSSFLHPNQIETASVSIGVKRKIPAKTENGPPITKPPDNEELNKKRKISEPKHKFHLI